MRTGRIFNIERCSTEDGPGIRTTVFLKGCLLRCKWCANPESQVYEKQILFKGVQCIGCGRCENICPSQAISNVPDYGMITDREKCTLCGKCIDACYSDARVIQGADYTVKELMDILAKDSAYYQKSGGGITFSGGEPLLQIEFVEACAKEIHEKGWNLLIETCGQVPLEYIQRASLCSDTIYCDYKHYSPEKHKELTGKDNSQIIENIYWLDKNFKGSLYLRYPYIPKCNDQEHEIREFLKFAENMDHVQEVVFLPYHRLGIPKYQGIGREYEMGNMESLKVNDIKFLKQYEQEYNIKISIQ